MMQEKTHIFRYVFTDYFAGLISWALFYAYRKIYIESPMFGIRVPIEPDSKFIMSLIFIPAAWLVLHYASGYYFGNPHKARLAEFFRTLITTLIGVVVIFFALILDDNIVHYRNYYQSFVTLFGLQFLLTYIPRLVFTTVFIQRLKAGKIWYNTIMLGNGNKALALYQKLTQLPFHSGNHFVGFVNFDSQFNNELYNKLSHLGHFNDIIKIIDRFDVKEVIVAVETEDHNELEKIITLLQQRNVVIKIKPNLYDILTGSVKMSGLAGTPLLEISQNEINGWQHSLKRLMDIVLSALALILLQPLFWAIALAIKIESNGPVLYTHERIGLNAKPFTIYKFRSMVVNAEANGPQLSTKNDQRITKVGAFLRRYKLDEIPQFWNVLIGEMSLVGPRPERQHYIDQIIEKAPHYVHLLKIRPGITSWGQIKFGYAENIEQMVQRLRYDLIYLENMSIFSDIVILFYTIGAIFRKENN